MSSRVLLRYELSNRGLFSEILNMINGYYYAEEKGWGFQLITDKERSRLHFSTGDYTYYFKKFWKDPLPDSDYEKIYHCYDIDETFRIIHKSVRISVAQKRALTQRIIRLQPAIAGKINAIISQLKLPPPGYVCFHIRRGDKLEKHGSQKPQAKRYEAEAYFDAARKYFDENSVECIYVCTDDYRALGEVEAIAPAGCRVLTLCLPSENGFSRVDRMETGQYFSSNDMIRIMANIGIASRSMFFVGTYSSGISKFIRLVHQDPSRCRSLDRR